MKKEFHSRFQETTRRVSFCSDKTIEINGQTFVPDPYNAYVEFFLSHAFPVVTCDGTAIHPQVVANSYQTMRGKVFDLAHIIRSYNPKENARDRVLGTIMEVEFPPTPAAGWKVQGDTSKAPGIRAVAVMHKQLEGVKQILTGYANRSVNWTVSMEQDYFEEETGFLVHGKKELEMFWGSTPDDLKKLGYVYVPYGEAPRKLKNTFNPEESRIEKTFNDQTVIILFGGLNGSVFYKGTGLTPEGKEEEARVSQMLASKINHSNALLVPLESTLEIAQSIFLKKSV